MNYYNSIHDLPIFNFDKVVTTNSLEWLFKKPVNPEKIKAVKLHKLQKAWLNVEKEMFNEFGCDEDYKQYIRLSLEAMVLRIKAHRESNATHITFAEIKEFQAKGLVSESTGSKLYENVAHLNRLGYTVKVKKTTVAEFYSIINVANKHGRDIKQ